MTGWNKWGGISCQCPLGSWSRNQEVLQSACYCVRFHDLTVHAVLTGQTVQLFGEGSNNDVVLYNVSHLVLQVLLIERDQGI